MNSQTLIAIEKIRPNRYQPRSIFNDETLYDLAQSIKENGLIQPIVVRGNNDEGYEIIVGERRYRAMQMIGRIEVPCLVISADDDKSAALALIENIQREDLSVYEEAIAYRRILEGEAITQKELASRLGKSQSTIANKLRLLDLPEYVLNVLNRKEITERHARALLSAPEERVEAILDIVLKKKLNVKETENLIRQEMKPHKPKSKGFAGHIRIGINTVNKAVTMVKETGINVIKEEQETEDEVIITLRFPK